MKFNELEQTVRGYAQLLIAQGSEAPEPPALTGLQKQEELARLSGILDQLQVREALQAVGDDVWQEGEVAEVTRNVSGKRATVGLALLSDPYKTVHAEGYGKGFTLELGEARASLSVHATSLVGLPRSTEVNVHDTGLYIERELTVPDAVVSLGMERGLRRFATGNLNRGFGLYLISSVGNINPDDSDALQKVLFGIVAHTHNRMRNQTLPRGIRDWADLTIASLPDKLLTEGRLGGADLRNWGHNVRGSWGVVRVLDRILPFAVGL